MHMEKSSTQLRATLQVWRVHVASRVAALAGPGELVVSRTVADLMAGSETHFEDRDEHELNGVSGRWRIFSVAR
jgi:class 3 adenylate cyclase